MPDDHPVTLPHISAFQRDNEDIMRKSYNTVSDTEYESANNSARLNEPPILGRDSRNQQFDISRPSISATYDELTKTKFEIREHSTSQSEIAEEAGEDELQEDKFEAVKVSIEQEDDFEVVEV